MIKPLFLDNASTTKASKEVVECAIKYSAECFYNPSAEYTQSIAVSKKIAEAREYVLKRLGASCGNVFFTSGATESNNLAIRGSLREGDSE